MRPVPLIALLLCAGLAPAVEPYGPYRAELVRVIDGDTFELDVHLWPGLRRLTTVRLARVDTPELRARSACERRLARRARDFVRRHLDGASGLRLTVRRRGKYGRIIGELHVPERGNLADALLESGLGRPYTGGRRRPWCQDEPAPK